jgi:acetylornithine/succinyldiaminopimelate/putrescine aminotransferase
MSTVHSANLAYPDAMRMLQGLRDAAGPRVTTGLSDAAVSQFASADLDLRRAIAEAFEAREALRALHDDVFRLPEPQACEAVQEGFLNFYDAASVNPYIALAARGPWIVTAHGAVLHDSGGYGMLGLGHGPEAILPALSQPWVIANIMTPSFSQRRFIDALRNECGHTRTTPDAAPPFSAFVCLNSGSEAVGLAARISDIHAANLTAPGGRHAGKRIKFLAVEGGFHGRTDRPAQASPSSRGSYQRHLASFRALDNLVTVPSNDVEALRRTFAAAEAEGVFFELFLIEPVMGEGNPGVAVTRAFYDAARELTAAAGTFLLVDSIQAGLRAHGVLSIVDYPGFQDAEPPDLETWSKAINAAQYPLSVLGMSAEAANTYERGVYGNTMTANPRALEVAIATLAALTPELRQNIRDRGDELVEALRKLQARHPTLITDVQGTGLLVSCHVVPEIPVVGFDGLETWCRKHGMGVIHGGPNALRFTPHFALRSSEIAWMIDLLDQAFVAWRTRLSA